MNERKTCTNQSKSHAKSAQKNKTNCLLPKIKNGHRYNSPMTVCAVVKRAKKRPRGASTPVTVHYIRNVKRINSAGALQKEGFTHSCVIRFHWVRLLINLLQSLTTKTGMTLVHAYDQNREMSVSRSWRVVKPEFFENAPMFWGDFLAGINSAADNRKSPQRLGFQWRRALAPVSRGIYSCCSFTTIGAGWTSSSAGCGTVSHPS